MCGIKARFSEKQPLSANQYQSPPLTLTNRKEVPMQTDKIQTLTFSVSPDTRSALIFLQNIIEEKTGSKPSRQALIKSLISAAYRKHAL